MITYIQIDREEFRAELRSLLMETLNEIKNTPSSVEQDEGGIELAEEILGKKRSTIYKDGSIPSKKFGKRLVFSRKELISYLQSQTIRKQSPVDAASRNLQKQAQKRLK